MKISSFRLNEAKLVSAAIIMALAVCNISCASSDQFHTIKNGGNSSRSKNRVIRIYPDLFKKAFHVKNKGAEQVDFYLFDNEYRIAYQNRLMSNEHIIIENLSAGSYIYEVFTDDVRNEHGKLVVR